MIRLQQERLQPFSFPLQGLSTVLQIMEEKFTNYISSGKPPITIEFSQSKLLKDYQLSNELRTSADRIEGQFNIRNIFQKLLDNNPPDSNQLKAEGSGVARVAVFLEQTEAEFQSLGKSPGDLNSLRGLKPNFLRVASDFY